MKEHFSQQDPLPAETGPLSLPDDTRFVGSSSGEPSPGAMPAHAPNLPATFPLPQGRERGSERSPQARSRPGRALLAALLILCVLGGGASYTRLAAIDRMPVAAGSPIVIKIGATLPLSGADNSFAQPVADALSLAINEANATHFLPGYTFILDLKNDIPPSGAHDPSTSVVNIVDLASDAQVAGDIGPLNSGIAKAQMPVTNQMPLVQISPTTTNPCLTISGFAGCTDYDDLVPTLRPTGKVTFFRLATPDNWQGTLGADFVFKMAGYHRVYLIDDSYAAPYSQLQVDAFQQEFLKDGGTLLGRTSIQPAKDYSQVLQKIAALHPDMIYFGGLDSSGGIPLYQQIERSAALAKTPFMGNDAIQTSSFIHNVSTPRGPVYSTIAATDARHVPGAAPFIQHYEATYGPLGLYSAASYDSAWILLNAIKAALLTGARVPTGPNDMRTAQRFRTAVIQQVARTHYEGVLGPQSFDHNGDTTHRVITITQLKNASWQYKTMLTPASL